MPNSSPSRSGPTSTRSSRFPALRSRRRRCAPMCWRSRKVVASRRARTARATSSSPCRPRPDARTGRRSRFRAIWTWSARRTPASFSISSATPSCRARTGTGSTRPALRSVRTTVSGSPPCWRSPRPRIWCARRSSCSSPSTRRPASPGPSGSTLRTSPRARCSTSIPRRRALSTSVAPAVPAPISPCRSTRCSASMGARRSRSASPGSRAATLASTSTCSGATRARCSRASLHALWPDVPVRAGRVRRGQPPQRDSARGQGVGARRTRRPSPVRRRRSSGKSRRCARSSPRSRRDRRSSSSTPRTRSRSGPTRRRRRMLGLLVGLPHGVVRMSDAIPRPGRDLDQPGARPHRRADAADPVLESELGRFGAHRHAAPQRRFR